MFIVSLILITLNKSNANVPTLFISTSLKRPDGDFAIFFLNFTLGKLSFNSYTISLSYPLTELLTILCPANFLPLTMFLILPFFFPVIVV